MPSQEDALFFITLTKFDFRSLNKSRLVVSSPSTEEYRSCGSFPLSRTLYNEMKGYKALTMF